MGHSTAQTTEDDSDGRMSPEPTQGLSRTAPVPVVGVLRHGTNLTTSSSSTELMSEGDERNCSRTTYSFTPYRWAPLNAPYIAPRYARKRKSDVPSCWSRQVVLSLDGGGIRGLSELCILERIFQAIAKIERSIDGAKSSECSPLLGSPDGDDDFDASQRNIMPDTRQYKPCHYFDYIGGTSMGGVVAVMLGRLRLSIDEAIQNFETIWISMAREVSQFHPLLPGRKLRAAYSEGLRNALDKIVPTPRKSSLGLEHVEPFRSDPNLCRTVVLAVQIDRERAVRRPYLFRSYVFDERKSTAVNRNKSNKTEDTPLKDVCLATSATPSYFQSVTINDGHTKRKFRDGSIWMTNPAMELYREVHSMHPDHPDQESPIHCLISIGCGKQKRSRLLPSISSPGASLYKWEQQQVDDVLRSRIQEGENFDYIRFTGPADLTDIKPSDWKIDGNRQKTVEKIKKAAAKYCDTDSVKQQIQRVAQQLVDYRRQRARTAHWERFALGIRYSCTWCTDEEKEELIDRDDAIDHVQSKHRDHTETDSYFFNEYRKILEAFQVPTTSR